MRTEIKNKLDEVVALVNNTDEVVLDNEVKAKLEKIIGLLDDPQEVTAEKEALNAKIEEIKVLINDAMIDLDVDVEYCVPGADGYDPHILLTYAEDEYTTKTRKVSLGNTALHSSNEDFTKHVLMAIEEFKEEVDDIKMG